MLLKRFLTLAVFLLAGSIAPGCGVSKTGDGSRNNSLTPESASPGSPGSKSLMDLPGPGLGVYGYRGTPQPAGSPRGAVNLASVVTSPAAHVAFGDLSSAPRVLERQVSEFDDQ